MGSLHELGFEVKPANAPQRMMQALFWAVVASSRPGAWLFSKTLHPQDKALVRRPVVA